MKKFIRHNPVEMSDDLHRVQDNIETVVKQFTDKKHLDSVRIEGITLTAFTTYEIPHTLGRAYLGWYIVDSDAGALFFRDTTSTADATKFLPIQSSQNVTIDIVVF